jgi:hypothetical protein
VAIVAFGIGFVVLAAETDRYGQVSQVVPIAGPEHLNDPNLRFAVG